MNKKIINDNKKTTIFFEHFNEPIHFTHFDKVEWSSEKVKGRVKNRDREKSLSDYFSKEIKQIVKHMQHDNKVKPITYWKVTVYNKDGVKNSSQTRQGNHSNRNNNSIDDNSNRTIAYRDFNFNYDRIKDIEKALLKKGYKHHNIIIEKQTRPGRFFENIKFDGVRTGQVLIGRNGFTLRCLLPETDKPEAMEKWFFDAIKYLIEHGYFKFKNPTERNIKTIAAFFHLSEVELNIFFTDIKKFNYMYLGHGDGYKTSMLMWNNNSSKYSCYNTSAKDEKRNFNKDGDIFKNELTLKEYIKESIKSGKLDPSLSFSEQLFTLRENVNNSVSSNYKKALGRKADRYCRRLPSLSFRMKDALNKKYASRIFF